MLDAVFLLAAQYLKGLIGDYIENEAALTAAVILRSSEDSFARKEGQSRLSTFELFTTAGGSLLSTSSAVVWACFLKHVRFKIYSALLKQPSLQANYQSFFLPGLDKPDDDIHFV
ncbi:hypothetical protein CC78DRAFT_540392 [Lojkania enalia]|uniref:Uncharacterized protein n=1 Tax=Lojkania enalia TaxID=147567 RepID=A0A9P4N8F4_9PLEO|nr:hypothetical protein CC78DRAFT_540392 [Didymosphaeria enalia]